MPAKYSHVKKRSASGLLKKSPTANGYIHAVAKDTRHHQHQRSSPSPYVDRSITQAMTAVSQLEHAIARILLIRYEQDIARLFSTRLYSIALLHLPTLMMRCISVGGPGWVAHNYDCEEIKDFFRAAISMDLRQAGERVATKSVLWSYTAMRHFAISNNVSICQKRGLHSVRLLPYYPAVKAHLDVLEAMPPPTFSKPPHLGPLTEGLEALEEACNLKYGNRANALSDWASDWQEKVRVGYEILSQTLWRVAREFDVRGYGMVLREKLTTKWCDCGCSTDHLGEVCERTVRDEDAESGVSPGKRREWDGRGSGVLGWETEEEEDIWEVELDIGGLDPDEYEDGLDLDMTIGELMEWRYLKAEREKEEGNVAFRRGDFEVAVKHYQTAHQIEPELPHYQLNLAAAHLKLCNWMEAEQACTKALGQHRSSKGYYRRARARKMLGRSEEAVKDLRAVLKLQPTNTEAITEIVSLLPPEASSPAHSFPSSSSSSREAPLFGPSNHTKNLLHLPKPKQPKPLPFSRTKSDDRKLKIVLMPMSVDMPVHEESCAHYCEGHNYEQNDGLPSPPPSPQGKGKQKQKQNIGSFQWDGKVQTETFMYPGWDRYVVRRAELC